MLMGVDINVGWSTAHEILVGSVAGVNYGTVEMCSSSGDILVTDTPGGGREVNSGGLVGTNGGTVKNCHSSVNVTGTGETGGIVGKNGKDVIFCYATGKIELTHSTNSSCGGVVGSNEQSNSQGAVKNCVAMNPSLKAINHNTLGRVVGRYEHTVQKNYARADMTIVVSPGFGANTITSAANGKDGESVSENLYSTQKWWSSNLGPFFSFGKDAWKWSNDHKLPLLNFESENMGLIFLDPNELKPLLMQKPELKIKDIKFPNPSITAPVNRRSTIRR